MLTWPWALVATLVVGLAVLLYGYVADRQRNARRAAILASAPSRRIPGQDPAAAAPRYVTAEQAARRVPRPALSAEDRESVDDRLRTAARRFDLPLPSPDFVTDGDAGRAVLLDPWVLVTDADITDVRMLYAPLQRAQRTRRALVVVAAGFAAPVLRTLAVNAAQDVVTVLPLTADADTRDGVADTVGVVALTASDLHAGYMPADALAAVALWVGDDRGSQLVPAQP